MTFTKQTDSASVVLARLAMAGGDPQLALVDFVDQDGEPFLRVELSGAVVTSFIMSSGKGSQSTESFSLNFGKMVIRQAKAHSAKEAQRVQQEAWNVARLTMI